MRRMESPPGRKNLLRQSLPGEHDAVSPVGGRLARSEQDRTSRPVQALPETREICPACGGSIVCHLTRDRNDDKTDLSVCAFCRKMWETPPESWRGTSPAQAGPCDNCAFRSGSSERADPHTWAEIERGPAIGRPFYCHKGVPRKLVAGDAPFEFDLDRLPEYRVCGGWARAVRALRK